MKESKMRFGWMVAVIAWVLFQGFGALDLAWSQGGGSANIFQSYAKPLPLPNFSLKDLQGKTVEIQAFKGKVILLNFWATWCPNCREETPYLEKFYQQYQTKNLVLFRIDTKESRETIRKFLGKNSSSLPILLDEKNRVGKLLGVWVHPTSYLVDSKGLIRYRAMGTVDWTGIEAISIVDRLLGEEL